jgi:hypothetical protein
MRALVILKACFPNENLAKQSSSKKAHLIILINRCNMENKILCCLKIYPRARREVYSWALMKKAVK